MAPAITTEGLTRAFGGVQALNELTLEVEPGEVMALLGPNGAGKTTTVRLLNGVLQPDAGSSRVLGLDPAVDGDAVRRRTGVMTEAAALDDRLTAFENVVTHARIRGIAADEAATRARQLLASFGVGDRADHTVQGFSTGQRKRVALARALLHDPEVLFLDEPTSGLDPEATRDVLEVIAGLARDRGRTVILCTHFLAEAGRLCERMAVLRHGRLLALGRPAELARELWRGETVELDLGGPAAASTVEAIAGTAGVLSVETSVHGAVATVDGRDVVPALVGRLVTLGATVYAVVPHPPTMEDVYFALTGTRQEEAV